MLPVDSTFLLFFGCKRQLNWFDWHEQHCTTFLKMLIGVESFFKTEALEDNNERSPNKACVVYVSVGFSSRMNWVFLCDKNCGNACYAGCSRKPAGLPVQYQVEPDCTKIWSPRAPVPRWTCAECAEPDVRVQVPLQSLGEFLPLCKRKKTGTHGKFIPAITTWGCII